MAADQLALLCSLFGHSTKAAADFCSAVNNDGCSVVCGDTTWCREVASTLGDENVPCLTTPQEVYELLQKTGPAILKVPSFFEPASVQPTRYVTIEKQLSSGGPGKPIGNLLGDIKGARGFVPLLLVAVCTSASSGQLEVSYLPPGSKQRLTLSNSVPRPGIFVYEHPCTNLAGTSPYYATLVRCTAGLDGLESELEKHVKTADDGGWAEWAMEGRSPLSLAQQTFLQLWYVCLMQRVGQRWKAAERPGSQRQTSTGRSNGIRMKDKDTYVPAVGAHLEQVESEVLSVSRVSSVRGNDACVPLSVSGSVSASVSPVLLRGMQETVHVSDNMYTFKIPESKYQEFLKALPLAKQQLADTVLDPSSVQLSFGGDSTAPAGAADEEGVVLYAVGLAYPSEPAQASEHAQEAEAAGWPRFTEKRAGAAPEQLAGVLGGSGVTSITRPWLCHSCEPRTATATTSFVCHSCTRELQRQAPADGAAVAAASSLTATSSVFICTRCDHAMQMVQQQAPAGGAETEGATSSVFVCTCCKQLQQVPAAEAAAAGYSTAGSEFFCTNCREVRMIQQVPADGPAAEGTTSSVFICTQCEHQMQMVQQQAPAGGPAAAEHSTTSSVFICTCCKRLQQVPAAEGTNNSSVFMCTQCEHQMRQQVPTQVPASEPTSACTVCQHVVVQPNEPTSVCTVHRLVSAAPRASAPPAAEKASAEASFSTRAGGGASVPARGALVPTWKDSALTAYAYLTPLVF